MHNLPPAKPKPCRPDGHAIYVGTKRQQSGAPPLRDDCMDVTMVWLDRVPGPTPPRFDYGFRLKKHENDD